MIVGIGDIVVVDNGMENCYSEVLAIVHWNGQESFILKMENYSPMCVKECLILKTENGISPMCVMFCSRNDIVKVAFPRLDSQSLEIISEQDWYRWLDLQHEC